METVVPLDPVLNTEISRDFSGGFPELVQIGHLKWTYPKEYMQYAEKYKNFKVRPDDVWVAGYPRSGTNLTQELVWLLTHNMDFEEATRVPTNTRSPLFDINTISTEAAKQNLIKYGINIESINERELWNQALFDRLDEADDRRVIKSHMPFCLLPKNVLTCGCKVIYIARYVKDVAVSHFHLQQTINGRHFVGTFEKFWNYMQNNTLMYNPYWEHIKQGWEQRHNKNFLFLFYEDLRKDFRGSILKIAEFLDKKLSQQELIDLEKFLCLENYQKVVSAHTEKFRKSGFYRNVSSGNNFVRKGQVGGWSSYFPEELNKQADKWITENIEKISNFKFPEYVKM